VRFRTNAHGWLQEARVSASRAGLKEETTVTTTAASLAPTARARDLAVQEPREGRADQAASIAGLLAVVAGLVVLAAVSMTAIVSLPAGNGQNVVAVATGSFGVIGTVVGAYFGVKLGADGRREAHQALRAETAKVEALSAHLPPGEAGAALENAARHAPSAR
jgi:hypothetical protein